MRSGVALRCGMLAGVQALSGVERLRLARARVKHRSAGIPHRDAFTGRFARQPAFRDRPAPDNPARHDGRTREASYLTVFFSAFPAVKRTTRRALILIGAPVCGLRAVRAFRCDVLNVPKPTKVIESPFLSALVMPVKNESTAAAALLLLSAASFAMS